MWHLKAAMGAKPVATAAAEMQQHRRSATGAGIETHNFYLP
ncbi:MAG: hypothetical protein AAFQ80_00960 [Cyanobacteria bacterium J06621_8]